MDKTSNMWTGVAAALALAWVAVSVAQYDEDFTVYREQTGAFPNFPFRNCNTTNGAYRLAPVWEFKGSNKYCFKIQVQNPLSCTGACCNTDMYKIEFNVSSSCLVQGASVVATVNGVPTRVGASFDKPPTGPSGSAILRITQLGLDTVTAQDAEVCITLRTNRGGQGCTTLEQLCSSPGFSAGTCTAAMYDTACDCCPTSTASEYHPPPPPPPVQPQEPPSIPNPPFAYGFRPFCDICIKAKLLAPFPDIRPFRYSTSTCSTIQQKIADSINALDQDPDLGFSFRIPFAPNETHCSGTEAVVCGSLYQPVNDTDSFKEKLARSVSEQMLFWLDTATGAASVCSPELEGYQVTIETNGNDSNGDICVEDFRGVACALPPPPYPNCTCDIRQGVMPFVVGTRYFAQPSLKGDFSTTEYCFTLSVLPLDQLLPSSCQGVDILRKIEWYANENLKLYVRGFTLYPKNGSPRSISSSWGATGSYTLKATNINWTMAQADGSKICVVVRNPVTMSELCLGALGSQCFATPFNGDKDCCPMFRTAPLGYP